METGGFFKKGILDHLDSTYSIWKNQNSKVVIVYHYDPGAMTELTDKILNEGYYIISGGIQLIRRDDAVFNASATFILKD